MMSVELQMAFFSASLALVDGRVARAEAPGSASHAHSVTFVVLSRTILVEAVRGSAGDRLRVEVASSPERGVAEGGQKLK